MDSTVLVAMDSHSSNTKPALWARRVGSKHNCSNKHKVDCDP